MPTDGEVELTWMKEDGECHGECHYISEVSAEHCQFIVTFISSVLEDLHNS